MEYAYHTKTIWCGHDGKRIFGIAFIPQREGKMPLVINPYSPLLFTLEDAAGDLLPRAGL